jgi:hypothetical protein
LIHLVQSLCVSGRLVSARPLTQSDYTRSCINTIVILKMSTELLETSRGFKKHIIEEIVRQVGHLPELNAEFV